MEFLLMLVTVGLIIAVIRTAVSRSRNMGSQANNHHKKNYVSCGRDYSSVMDESYRGEPGSILGRSYIGLEAIKNDLIK